MIGTFITAVKLFGIGKSLLMVAGLVLALGTMYGVWHHRVYQSGVDDTLAAVARADAKTIAKALEKRRVFNDCRTRGLSWDQTTGVCK